MAEMDPGTRLHITQGVLRKAGPPLGISRRKVFNAENPVLQNHWRSRGNEGGDPVPGCQDMAALRVWETTGNGHSCS
jgi:hypothetical protein